jgi:hypothetical protein
LRLRGGAHEALVIRELAGREEPRHE